MLAPVTEFTADDVGAWPYSVSLLVKFVAFLGTLHWLAAEKGDLGRGGVSYVEMLILYELWAGERLVLGKSRCTAPQARAPNFSVSCARAGSSVPSSGRCLPCLVVLVGLCSAQLVPITAG